MDEFRLQALNCENCGASLPIPSAVKYVTCGHCGTNLHVQRTEDAAWTERFEAITSRVDQATQRLDEEIENWKIDRRMGPIVGGFVGLMLALLGIALERFFDIEAKGGANLVISTVMIVVSIGTMAALGWLVIRVLEYKSLRNYRWLTDQQTITAEVVDQT